MDRKEMTDTVDSGEWAAHRARERLDNLTKPLGSLGDLESLITRLAAITTTPIPRLQRPVCLVFAADHGVVLEGVSAYEGKVTEEMAVNVCMGGSVSSVFARTLDIPLTLVDVGIRSTVRHPAAVVRKVAAGTRNFVHEPAMTVDEAKSAVQVGEDMAEQCIDAGHDVLLLGELGIGNTTSASAMAAMLLACPVHEVVGMGSGLDTEGLERKRRVVERAVARHQPDVTSLWDVLAKVGGLELAALAGACLAAAQRRVPVVLDGFMTAVAALWAVRYNPAVAEVLVASHQSAEPGHQRVLSALGLQPLLQLNLRLGEGSGALLAWPLIRLACSAMAEVATFADAQVSNPHAARASKVPPAQPNEPSRPAPVANDFSTIERDAVYKAILARRDIRVFLPDDIPPDVLRRILLAGHHAPSVGYMQPWNFIVIRNREVIRKLHAVVDRERVRAAENYQDLRQQHYLRLKVEGLLQAPVTICVTNNPERGGPHVLGRNTIPETDLMSTACAIENMWLAARAEGIAMGWVSMYEKADVQEILSIPPHIEPAALLSLGYTPHFPDIPLLERVGWSERLPFSEMVFENEWGRKWL